MRLLWILLLLMLQPGTAVGQVLNLEQLPDPPEQVADAYHRGLEQYAAGEYGQALQLLQKAVRVLEQEQSSESDRQAWTRQVYLFSALASLGAVFGSVADPYNAMAQFSRAAEIGKELPYDARLLPVWAIVSHGQASAQLQHALLYPSDPNARGFLNRAVEAYEQAKRFLKLSDRTGVPIDSSLPPMIELEKAVAKAMLGNSAAETELTVLSKSLPGDEMLLRHMALKWLGLIRWKDGRLKEAVHTFEAALDTWPSSAAAEHPVRRTTQLRYGELLYAAGYPDSSFAVIDRALAAEENLLLDLMPSATEETLLRYTDALTYAGLATLLSLIKHSTDERTGISPSRAHLATKWILRRRALVSTALARLRASPIDPHLEGRLRRLRGRLAEVNATLASIALSGAETEPQRDSLMALRQQLTVDLARISVNDIGFEVQDVTVEAIRRQLDRGDALLELIAVPITDPKIPFGEARVLGSRYMAAVITEGGATSFHDLGEVESVDDLILQLRTTHQAATDMASFASASQALYSVLIAPLMKVLHATSRVYVVADGDLNLISFDSLMRDDNRYLWEELDFVYLTSGRQLLEFDSSSSNQGTVVIADPSFDMDLGHRREVLSRLDSRSLSESGQPHDSVVDLLFRTLDSRWDSLPGTTIEAAEIESLLARTEYAPVTAYTRETALEEVFKALVRPRIVHIATHGFFVPFDNRELYGGAPAQGPDWGASRGVFNLRTSLNPLHRSGLVFAGANHTESSSLVDDGWLLASEIESADLRGTELVVLSACDTGLGQIGFGEGVLGLRRAFQIAGVETIVMSLHKVPDSETQLFFSDFYRLLAEGNGRFRSFKGAQRRMRERGSDNPRLAHPLYWASFIYAGRTH